MKWKFFVYVSKSHESQKPTTVTSKAWFSILAGSQNSRIKKKKINSILLVLEKQLHFGHLQIHNQERRSLSCPHTTELATADCFFPKHNNLPDVVRWFINNKVFWAMFYSWKLPVSMSSSRGLQIEDHGMTSGNRDRHREVKLARICQLVFLIIWKQSCVSSHSPKRVFWLFFSW